MVAVVVGLTFISLGAWGLLVWFDEFLFTVKGWGPISLILGGLIAIIMGISSFRAVRDGQRPKK